MSDDGQQAGGESVVTATGEQRGSDRQGAAADNGEQAGDEPVFPDLTVGTAWGKSITKGRAAELEATLHAWEQDTDHGERMGPFDTGPDEDGVPLTGADVFWLAARTLASTSGEPAIVEQMERLRRAPDDIDVQLGLHLSALHLDGADVSHADLTGAHLTEATFAGADLYAATLAGAHLVRANLAGVDLEEANLTGANLDTANLNGVRLLGATLARARFQGATLAGAKLMEATLIGADLAMAELPDADLFKANLAGADLDGADLTGADLRTARMSVETDLNGAELARTLMADVIWNGVALARVAWERLPVVGDETQARQPRDREGAKKDAATRREDYAAATRSYRLLAVTLRSQGLNEHADRYAYRAQLMQRVVLRLQRHFLRWLGSLFLWLIAGYGYRPLRSILTYALVVVGFAAIYFALGGAHGQALSWNEAVVVSLTAFHGRGFFATAFQPGDPQAAVAASEAVIGLLIEITFIATFTNRFFAR